MLKCARGSQQRDPRFRVTVPANHWRGGVGNWMPHDEKELDRFIDTAKHLAYATIANSINMKRALRSQVEQKLNALIKQVAALKEQLDCMERKMNASDPVTSSPP